MKYRKFMYMGVLFAAVGLTLSGYGEKVSHAADDISDDSADTITVCIDPGHFVSEERKIYFDDGTYYCEGETTLKIALKLQEILQNQYGIASILTRDTDSITINGYTDSELDSGHLSLRGKMAKGCDFFISIHTNANNDNANGYEACFQPISINKPIVIANFVAKEDATALTIANGIGTRLAAINSKYGLSTVSDFETVADSNSLPEWTDTYNDALDTAGTVCIRTGSDGDYYGVLRGAATVKVPGTIVEHAFHTVEEVREAIAEGELITEWAQADADAIAEGFGITALEAETESETETK